VTKKRRARPFPRIRQRSTLGAVQQARLARLGSVSRAELSKLRGNGCLSSSWGASGAFGDAFDDAFDDHDGDAVAVACVETRL